MQKILFYVLILAAFNSFADDKSKDEMMKKWQEFSTPSAEHKFLATMVGNWTYTQKMWEPGQSKAEEAKGTAKMKMILGGRYLQQDIKGTAMGMPYEGTGLTGYDNLKKKTVSTWADNMGTSILHGSGTLNIDKKIMSEEGQFTCPMVTDNTANFRSDWIVNDKNTMTFIMFNKIDGKEHKMMEMIYKRVK